jgi:hypothetical protein
MGDTYTGQVTLDSPAPSGGQVVNLSSSPSGGFTMPSSVTVPANATSAQFSVSVNTGTTPNTSASITASCNGGSASVSGRIVENDGPGSGGEEGGESGEG